jgi:hypothetical protein
MPTYNDGLGYNLNDAAYPAHTQVRESIVEIVLDIAEVVAARAAASAVALADGDTLEIIKVPAQCVVLAAGVETDGNGDASLVLDLGDDADPNGFVATMAVDAAQTRCNVGAIPAVGYQAGQYYPSANTLDITLSGAVPTTGIIRVWAKVVDGAGYYPISETPSATP